MRVFRQQSAKPGYVFPTPIQIDQYRGKYLSQYRPRKNSDRLKDKIKQGSIKRSFAQLQKSPIYHRNNANSNFRYKSDNGAFNQQEVIELNNRSKSFVSRQRQNYQRKNLKSYELNLMFVNIKDTLKQNQVFAKNIKDNDKQTFLAVRSHLRQQLYKNEQIRDFYPYKMVSNGEEHMVRPIVVCQKSGRCALNPFIAEETVTCTSAVLNQPLKNQINVESSYGLRSNTESITKSVSKVNKPSNIKKSMCFTTNNIDYDGSYLRKLKNYFDFLFKVNFSNNIYVDMNLAKSEEMKEYNCYKVFVGKGNNSILVQNIIKKRFWWQITHNSNDENIDFYWTQNKVDKFHLRQAITKKIKSKGFQRIESSSKKFKLNEQLLQNNKKILTGDKCSEVQSYINSGSFFIPFGTSYQPDVITNHLPKNNCIGSKKNLFKSLFHYYSFVVNKNPFEVIPKTYHIHSLDSQEYLKFQSQNEKQPHKIWIVKPGQNSNRGKSIKLAPFQRLSQLFAKQKTQKQSNSTFIIQSYINKPFLYNNRKFDIRHYMLITSVNGIVKGYWYRQGYIRTSSISFNLQNTEDLFIHLTNDAIQKHCEFYEKYEPANKLSYGQFQRYLDIAYPTKQYNFEKDILGKMKEIAKDTIKSNYLTIDSYRMKNNFQIFGLDFMVDKEFKPWLIEVNYNPCLEVNCNVLQRIIPGMLESSLRLGLDPLYPPPYHYPVSKRFYLADNYLKNLKYELIFDQDALQAPIVNDYDFQDQSCQRQQFNLQEMKEKTEVSLSIQQI